MGSVFARGFFGFSSSASSSSGSTQVLGPKVTYASPAGIVAAAPPGFTTATGRVIVTLAAGNATWPSMTGGQDGQLCMIINEDAANSLTLSAASWGGVSDLVLPPKARVLSYYDGTATTPNWKVTE